jgi:hypothetical protein
VPHIVFSSILLSSPVMSRAEEIAIGRFNTEGISGWEPKSFKGITDYRLVQENSKMILKAASHASASGLVKNITFDPKKYRYLRWSWKIKQTIPGGDEKTKSGDDYAARIYIVFPGKYFWQMQALNYIWANRLPKGTFIASPYAAGSKMIAVESGNGKAGQWVTEERDLLADYRTLFGTDPPDAEAIAIMTDTDNSGGVAEAWYGDIVLSTER